MQWISLTTRAKTVASKIDFILPYAAFKAKIKERKKWVREIDVYMIIKTNDKAEIRSYLTNSI